MKRKTICQNGNMIERWYDRKSRSTVIQVLDANGDQIGDADYSGNKQSADFAHEYFIKQNGGEINK